MTGPTVPAPRPCPPVEDDVMFRLVVTQVGRTPHEVLVRRVSPVRIGRAPSNHVVLSEDGVSRHHLALWVADSDLWARDLGSRNGTFLEGTRLPPGVPVRVYGELRLGEGTHVAVSRPGWAPVRAPPRPVRADDLPREPTSECVREPMSLGLRRDPAGVAEALLECPITGKVFAVAGTRMAELLHLLGGQVLDDRERGLPASEAGWWNTTELCRALWGRDDESALNNLHALLYRMRKQLRAVGLDPCVLDGRRGAVHLRDVEVRASAPAPVAVTRR